MMTLVRARLMTLINWISKLKRHLKILKVCRIRMRNRKYLRMLKMKRRLTTIKRIYLTEKIIICIELWCTSMQVILKELSKTMNSPHLLCMLKKYCIQETNSQMKMTTWKVPQPWVNIHLKLIFQMLVFAHSISMNFLSILSFVSCKWKTIKKL